jgi:hypothetical protein
MRLLTGEHATSHRSSHVGPHLMLRAGNVGVNARGVHWRCGLGSQPITVVMRAWIGDGCRP